MAVCAGQAAGLDLSEPVGASLWRYRFSGADPNAKDKYGRTALWWASNYGHIEVVKLLREAGATE